ncbi:MAG: hypothetical protein K2K48_02630 [Anaeroplasmataceae bacterium]|nr:hypothetical protein [Anaeroplasmataceae bacterium]MDE6414284.1 hypothetical protein [Anaeroplasmataceae bacterium]
MKNLFQVYYDKNEKKTIAEYDSFVIRRVSKKQEEELTSLSQKYSDSKRNRGMPKWLNLINRISFTATFTSFIFLIVSLIVNARENKGIHINEYLWLGMIFGVSVVIFVFSIVIAHLIKKKRKGLKPAEVSQEVFNKILETSKEFLSVPDSAKSLEILMEEVDNEKEAKDEIRKFSNVLLSVFVENDLLCFADLYVVIGIPIKDLSEFERVEEPYRFDYWHKSKEEKSYEEYGIELINKATHTYQADHYVSLTMNIPNQDLRVYFPAYEIDVFQTILK